MTPPRWQTRAAGGWFDCHLPIGHIHLTPSTARAAAKHRARTTGIYTNFYSPACQAAYIHGGKALGCCAIAQLAVVVVTPALYAASCGERACGVTAGRNCSYATVQASYIYNGTGAGGGAIAQRLLRLEPQHCTAPELVMPQLWAWPAAMARMPVAAVRLGVLPLTSPSN